MDGPDEHRDRPRRLTRSTDRKLAGVCGGIADYFDLDPTLVRIVFVVLLLFPFFPLGGGLLLYLILWVVMPDASPENAARVAARAEASSGRGIDGGILLGGLLLVIGFLFLFQRTVAIWGPTWWFAGAAFFIWPVVLIAIGTLVLLAALGRRS